MYQAKRGRANTIAKKKLASPQKNISYAIRTVEVDFRQQSKQQIDMKVQDESVGRLVGGGDGRKSWDEHDNVTVPLEVKHGCKAPNSALEKRRAPEGPLAAPLSVRQPAAKETNSLTTVHRNNIDQLGHDVLL